MTPARPSVSTTRRAFDMRHSRDTIAPPADVLVDEGIEAAVVAQVVAADRATLLQLSPCERLK